MESIRLIACSSELNPDFLSAVVYRVGLLLVSSFFLCLRNEFFILMVEGFRQCAC